MYREHKMASGSYTLKVEKPKDLVLYMLDPSAPSRCVMMAAVLVDIPLKYERVNILKGEQMTPEFLKMNPDHIIPTLKDGSVYLWESRAISKYLINRYATGHSLYPLDPVKRATIDRLLDWDLGHLFKAVADYCYPVALHGTSPAAGAEDAMKKILENMNGKLEGKKYLAGDVVTLADLSAIFNLTWMAAHPKFDFSPYPNVRRWRETMTKMPEFVKVNGDFDGFVKSRLAEAGK